MKLFGDSHPNLRRALRRLHRQSINWIVAGPGTQPSDIQAQLLQHSLLNNITLVMLTVSMSAVAIVAIALTGEAWAYAWLLAELLIGHAKISFKFSVDKNNTLANTEKATGPIVAGLAGGVVLGIAGYQCVGTGDPLLILLSGICLAGLVVGTSVRSAGTPRFAMLLMCLMTLPYSLATLISPLPYLFVIGVQMPLLLGGLVLVLQEDYKTLVNLYLAQRENLWMANHDMLTGLPNRIMKRRRFEDLLRQQDPASSNGVPLFTVFCLDLDGFKEVNDRLGHAAGDAVLVAAAGRLRGCVRDVDLLFRVGGDEFVILLPSILPAEAAAIAQRIIARISEPFDVGGSRRMQIGVSIGSSLALTDGATADELLRSADRALYEAKRRGRNLYISRSAMQDRMPELPPRADTGIRTGPPLPGKGAGTGLFPLPFAGKSV